MLDSNGRRFHDGRKRGARAALTGRIFDADGEPMSPPSRREPAASPTATMYPHPCSKAESLLEGSTPSTGFRRPRLRRSCRT